MVKILPSIPQIPASTTLSGPAWLHSRQEQQRALSAAGQEKVDSYDLAMQAAAIVLAVVQAESFKGPIKTIGYGLQGGIDGAKGAEARGVDALKSLDGKRNPFFEENKTWIGQQSPVTQRYLTTRRWKKVGGSAVQAVGALSSLIPHMVGVNVAGAIYHGQAAGLTTLHMAKIGGIAAKYRSQKEAQDWCRLVEAAKAAKLSIRGAQTIGSVIPLATLPTAIAAAALKAGIKLTTAGACYAAAAAIHWMAFVEQGFYAEVIVEGRKQSENRRLASEFTLPPIRPLSPLTMAPTASPRRPLPIPQALGDQAGPASAIFWELFTKRGATLAFGKYDIANLIREPAGWLALGDKLLLI